jgi:5'-nucleotidase/2',3'-cyclic-nucleotide 2'-phosphodiesterase/3'-nucleotidase/5'-nucleotidase
VPADSPYYPAIRCLTCAGAIGGYEDGTFRPGDAVTRGQLAKIVARGAGLEGDAGEQVYEDVPPPSTYYQWINRLSQLHVVGGYPCGTSADEPCVGPANRPYFRPGASATRAQIAKIVSEVAGYNELTVSSAFGDVSPSSPFETAIDRLRLHGDVTGYPCGTRPDEPCEQGYNRSYFRPGNTATRGQVAIIVAHAFHPECSAPAP